MPFYTIVVMETERNDFTVFAYYPENDSTQAECIGELSYSSVKGILHMIRDDASMELRDRNDKVEYWGMDRNIMLSRLATMSDAMWAKG